MIVGGALVVALFAALIVPPLVDWSIFRAEFEREATRLLGRAVHVRGEASVRLLPSPRLTFAEVAVGAWSDGTPIMTARRVTVEAELAPLLQGDLRVTDMELDGPRLVLRLGETAPGASAPAPTDLDPGRIRLEQVRVADGSLVIDGLAGTRPVEMTAIAADLSAQALTGPWRVEARGRVDGVPVVVDASTGRRDETGSVRLRLSLQRQDEALRLDLDGRLATDAPRYDGTFALAPATGPAAAAPLPVVASGRFEAVPSHVGVPEFRLEVGPREDPYLVTGTADLAWEEQPRFTVDAQGRQVDLDHVEAMAGQATTGATLATRLALLRTALDRIPIPRAQGSITLALPAVVTGDTVIREVSAVVAPADNAWRIETLRAVLPGDTALEATGRLATGADFGFSGRLVLASRQPTGFAAWLGGDPSGALRRLEGAGLEADVVLTDRQAVLDNLEIALGKAVLTGKVTRVAGPGTRPALIAELAGGTVDLDDLRAVYALAGGSDEGEAGGSDLDITIDAGRLSGLGLSAGEVSARVRLEGGSLSIDRLEAGDFYGARLRSSGRLAGVNDRPEGNFALNVEARDGGGLIAFLRSRLGPGRVLDAMAADPSLVSPLRLDLTVESRATGGAAKATIALTGQIGGTDLRLTDRFDGHPRDWAEGRHDLAARLQQPEPARLARQLGLPVLPLDAPGPVSLNLELFGTPARRLDVQLAAAAPGTDASVSGRLDGLQLVEAAPAVESEAGGGAPQRGDWRVEFDAVALDLTLGSADLDPYLLLSGLAVPGLGTGTPASLAAHVETTGNDWRVAPLSGQIAGVPLSGELDLSGGAAGRPRLSGSLDLDELPLPALTEWLLGAGSVIAAGEPLTPFAPWTPPAADLDLRLSAKQVSTGAPIAVEAMTGRLSVGPDGAALEEIKARVADGTVEGRLRLRRSADTAQADMQMTVRDADLAALGGAAGYDGPPQGRIDVSATLDGAGRSLDALIASLGGSGVLGWRDGVIAGVSLEGLPSILAVADQDGFTPSAESVAGPARTAVLEGRTPLDPVQAPFTVASGRVNLRNLVLKDGPAALRGEATLALPTLALDARLEARLAAGAVTVDGGEPSVVLKVAGRPGETVVTLETGPLENFLSLRALEREQEKVEALQASVVERQRLRREVTVSQARQAFRERERQAELERLQEMQQRLEAERQRREAEAAEARRLAEDEAARAAAQKEAARKAAAEAAARRQKAEAEKAAAAEAARKVSEDRRSREGLTIRTTPAPRIGGAADAPTDLLRN